MRRITDWFRRRGSRTLRIPQTGRALILSDLHGNTADWRAFLDKSHALERLADGEDLWLLLTGDVPDVARHQTIDTRVPNDGDVQILDELIEARAALGERGKRIVYLEGNHDYHVARICVEAAHFEAVDLGKPSPTDDDLPAITPELYARYCEFYREQFGDAMFENNIGPYDMVPRANRAHLRMLKSGPILAVFPGAKLMVTHAGPPRMENRRGRELMREIDTASARTLRTASRDDYYESPYHQLLNNRFPNGNYTLEDLERFCALYSGNILVTGHTPHPYLVDFRKKLPLDRCAFLDGVGTIDDRQVVLCSSFGAFEGRWKRYIEIECGHPYANASELAERGCVRALYSEDELEAHGGEPLPGAELIACW